ncbi:M23 family metallopeptidase [Arcicella aquatica]|uniref:M23 family metallopeptidase n=1 Tax=Arcicella aquatica TaxID=217141 RepID=A0ABU5QVG0_9BACT|nr:M23 family metallopeptidase [Arcicella aquatica]MEA5260825.1 M23 family metallopeptidase [Arcicella aquatica]
MKIKFKKLLLVILTILVLGFLIPQSLKMPVKDATIKSYSQDSYWFFPWGKSVTHKGVDIFAKKGTPVYSSTYGIVIFKGQIEMGGNVVLVLGPKWRLHYYAHLDRITTKQFSFITMNSQLGTVGTTGNAVGKLAHLHYTIRTIIPYLWRFDRTHQGWKKMFYLNPIPYLNQNFSKTN